VPRSEAPSQSFRPRTIPTATPHAHGELASLRFAAEHEGSNLHAGVHIFAGPTPGHEAAQGRLSLVAF
jgi:hypothetical protein